jgi:hypothetical protein
MPASIAVVSIVYHHTVKQTLPELVFDDTQ